MSTRSTWRHRENGISATDDTAIVELAGTKVKIVHGNKTNFKITTMEDLIMARAIINAPGSTGDR